MIGKNKPNIYENKYVELSSFSKNKHRQTDILQAFQDRPELTGLKKRNYANTREYENAILEWYSENFV
jgi:hypothetical protein